MDFLNLREHCGWVHEQKDATEKARRLLNVALNTEKKSLDTTRLNAGKDILVTGTRFLVPVIEKLTGLANVSLLLTEPDHRMLRYNLPLYVGSIRSINGQIGDFTVEISAHQPVNFKRCILCGRCVQVCPKGAIDFSLKIDNACDQCGKCIDACPVEAINFQKNEAEPLICGQIVVTEPGWEHTKKLGVHINENGDISGALIAAMDAIINIGVVKKYKILEVNDRCASGKSEIIGCTLCELVCPHDAISRTGDNIIFNDVSCLGCGACTAVCPISIPKLHAYPDNSIYAQIDSLLTGKERLSNEIIMFTCVEQGQQVLDELGKQHITYPPVLPILIPCINAVHEAHILYAFESGADGVVLLGCENCKHKINDNSPMNVIKTILNAVDFNEKFAVIQADPNHPEALVHELYDFVDNLPSCEKRRKMVAGIKGDNKRFVLLDLIDNLPGKSGDFVQRGDIPFGNVTIDGECIMCNACMNMCPTEALNNRSGKIYFNYSLCIACGLCEKACPEHVIRLEKILDIARLSQRETILAEPEQINCLACNKPFITKGAIARVSDKLGPENEIIELLYYCQDCRPIKAFEKGLLK
ncbi:MAG: 4Fe-4S binding protein [ANME-2 cluster archaeon]|nr:4Fe-4S binding protein [ANME-2 cluster archaeon]